MDFKKILNNILAFFRSLGIKIGNGIKNWWVNLNKSKLASGTAKAGALTFYHVLMTGLRVLVTVILIAITTCMVFACFFIFYIKTNLNSQLDINFEDYSINQTSVVYCQDSDTGEWQELCQLRGEENRKWISYDEISKYIEHAAVSIEDKRFYEHKGVDWYRTVAAFFNMFLSNSSTFGGSTLTQQLIKNLTQENDDTIPRKLIEIFRALELEKNYTKENILEWYLNIVYFGRGNYGISAAADYYFGKEVKDLSIAECATIIAITNNPSLYDPYRHFDNNEERRIDILREMYRQEYISKDEYDKAISEDIESVLVQHTITTIVDGTETTVSTTEPYSWFVDALIEEAIADIMEYKNVDYKNAELLLLNSGYQIYSTIDLKAQNIVDTYYENLDNFVTYRSQQIQSAIVISDPYTGDIIAMAGGVGEKTQSRILNRATQAKRSPGSSIKPLSAYAPAMELGYITPDTYIEDSDLVHLSGKYWLPENDGGGYAGIITIREALQRSINTVAAQLVDMATPSYVYNFLTETLHFSTLEEEDCDYAPLALGATYRGVTVRDMASAYSIFPNNGVYTGTRTYSEIYSAEGELVYTKEPITNTAISEATAYWMTRLLNNAALNGTGWEASFSGMPVAGKTGTAGGSVDRWFCGFTPYYVAAVWTGYDSPTEIVWPRGGNPSAQIFRTIMSQIHAELPYKDFSTPSSTYLTPVSGVDKEVEYTIRCVTDTGTLLSETKDKGTEGTTLSITAPEIEGYTFKDANLNAKLDIEVESMNPGYTWNTARALNGNSISCRLTVHTELNVFEFIYSEGVPEPEPDPDDPNTSEKPDNPDNPSTSEEPDDSSDNSGSSSSSSSGGNWFDDIFD